MGGRSEIALLWLSTGIDPRADGSTCSKTTLVPFRGGGRRCVCHAHLVLQSLQELHRAVKLWLQRIGIGLFIQRIGFAGENERDQIAVVSQRDHRSETC